MTRATLRGAASAMVLGLMVLVCNAVLFAEAVKIEGYIIGSSGDQITVSFGSGAQLTVVVTQDTEVSQIGRLSSPSKMNIAMATLIPGLKVKVEGEYNAARQVVANSVKFKDGDLAQARAAQAATHSVKVQNEEQQAQLEQHDAELRSQNAALQQHQAQLTEQQKQIAANTARFGQLDDYYIW